MEGFTFLCPKCGTRHSGLPALAYAEPAACVDEFGQDLPVTKIRDDFRIFGNEHFCVRTVFEVPIAGQGLPLEWGVWASLSQANFQRYWDSYDDAGQSRIGGMFSYFWNQIGGYPATVGLRCDVLPRDGGQRPLLILQQGQDHPLVHDQTRGITLERAIELAMPVLHPPGKA
jgi:hypothetical protein